MFAKRIKLGSRKIRIALKFCGSCNPQIDLSLLSAEVRRFIAGQNAYELVQHDSPDIDILIILCGCMRACADKEEIKSQAKHSFVITGGGFHGSSVPEKDLAAALTAELELIAGNFGD